MNGLAKIDLSMNLKIKQKWCTFYRFSGWGKTTTNGFQH